MLVIPAIDILGGRCVRLWQGDFQQSTTYSDDPASLSVDFERAGAQRVHVVDLDAARTTGDNRAVIEALIAKSSLTVQVAGGIRSEEQVASWLASGATAVVMGTAAVREPELLAECARKHGGQVMAALDIRNGKPAVSGWVEIETADVDDLIARWNELPLAGLILTSTERDGTMAGPDLDVLKRVRALSRLPIQYSGGVSSLEDVRLVREADAAGVILGRSLYEGRISLEEALAL
ncbi:MAG TPA: 1-(5-phosphoribosyl)-5-[(5-phosphoribosylamino)methylideneamino]imidazole-4-carboxamide isomerase [Candidatus Dormibacteraeota bacterium]|nr:1-(5-phosphoribosyl)-5-[(5-phosphoribosylamino)methylideneamino]imidazole-4-carboxamide isomerase [Candidatus Dormibacteraeota bacterium]